MSINSLCLFAAVSVLVLSGMSAAYAVPTISLDKTSYHTGDTVTISGTISELEPGQFVLLQVKSQSDIVTLDQFIPSSKSFSKTIPAEGPKWSESGTYTVVVSYLGETTQKTFQFSKENNESNQSDTGSTTKSNQDAKDSGTEKDPAKDTTSTQNNPKTQDPANTQDISENANTIPPKQETTPTPRKPLISIQGFPDTAQPPQYYYKRYGTEPNYKEWFDSIFVGYSINDVVGYQTTHIPGFPDDAKSPQYYIDRYNSEPEYRDWFDSQFPGYTIQDIVIPSDKIQNTIPAQIKDTARMWASGQLQDDSFANVIRQLIDNDVIQNESGLGTETSKVQSVPDWVKNNAEWWADGLITENDFLFGIEELIKRGIIEI